MGTFYSVKIAGVAQDKKLAVALRGVVERRFDEINRQLSTICGSVSFPDSTAAPPPRRSRFPPRLQTSSGTRWPCPASPAERSIRRSAR